MEVWKHGSLTHEFVAQFNIQPLKIAKENKWEAHRGAFSYYFFPLTVTAEFGSLPTTDKEQRKALKTLRKVLNIK